MPEEGLVPMLKDAIGFERRSQAHVDTSAIQSLSTAYLFRLCSRLDTSFPRSRFEKACGR